MCWQNLLILLNLEAYTIFSKEMMKKQGIFILLFSYPVKHSLIMQFAGVDCEIQVDEVYLHEISSKMKMDR